MTFVHTILTRLPCLAKPQLTFMLRMFSAFFLFSGRANRTNLARYGAPSVRSQARWAKRAFDFLAVNLAALVAVGARAHRCVGVIDETFIEKAGKETFGLGKFYDGCLGRARRGLACSVIGIIDLVEHVGYSLDAEQVVDQSQQTRLQAAVGQFQRVQAAVSWIETWVADGAYAKRPFVDAVVATGSTFVSKLRKDANMQYLYTGPQKPRGRRRQYDGKVYYDDFARWQWCGEIEEGVTLLSCVVHHKSLKRNLRVAMLRWRTKNNDFNHILLFSTDINMTPQEIVAVYQARFQIEFIFRDAKQHTGLEHCQARDQKSLHFHFNLSLAALNFLRIEEIKRGEGVISIASVKRRKQNEYLINRIFSILGIESTSKEIQSELQALRDYGVIAA